MQHPFKRAKSSFLLKKQETPQTTLQTPWCLFAFSSEWELANLHPGQGWHLSRNVLICQQPL